MHTLYPAGSSAYRSPGQALICSPHYSTVGYGNSCILIGNGYRISRGWSGYCGPGQPVVRSTEGFIVCGYGNACPGCEEGHIIDRTGSYSCGCNICPGIATIDCAFDKTATT
ncbi:hypothetical protein D3C72_1165580 [compost metagenome]